MCLNRTVRSSGVLVAMVLMGGGSLAARAADSAAIATLKAKGLTRSSHTFVIEAEKPVLDKLKEVKAAYASYAAVADRQALTEQVGTRLTEMEERRSELQTHLNDLNQQITEQASNAAANQAPGQGQGQGQGRMGINNSPQRAMMNEMIAQRDHWKSVLAELVMEQKSLKEQGYKVKDPKTLDEEVRKQGDAFKAALAALRPMVDEVVKKYAELGADESVKKAVKDLETESKADFKLGPSEPFQAGVKALDQAERKFLGKKPATVSRKKVKTRK